VDGRVLVQDRKILSFDVDGLLREVRAMTKSLRKRNEDLFKVASDLTELVP
jgi:hypothetical protein